MTTGTDARADALQEIAAIARRHGLSAAEVAAALAPGGPAAPNREARRRGALVRVLAFLGGTFVFAGLGLFMALQWEHMNAAARIVVTLGSGVVAFALAVLGSRDDRFARAATPLFLMAAALEPAGMLVAFAELGSGGDWRWASLITAGTMALQFAAAVWTLGRTTPLFACLLFTVLFWWTAFDLLEIDGEAIALAIGSGLVLASVGLDRTRHADITPFWYLTGAIALLTGLFWLVEGTVLELAFLAAAARPFLRSASTARSMSPCVSARAFLQSIIPAPVRSLRALTSAALTFVVLMTHLRRSGRAPPPAPRPPGPRRGDRLGHLRRLLR